MAMENKNLALKISQDNPFIIKELDLNVGEMAPILLKGAALILCTEGKASITINTRRFELLPRSEAVLFPMTVFCVRDCSADFKMTVFLCSEDILRTAHRKFDPEFFNHLNLSPVYRHPEGSQESTLAYFSIIGRIASDTGNRYRIMIVANLLRSLLLNIYDKVQRYSKDSSAAIFTRKEEIYNSFLDLIVKNAHNHRDVAFYADSLCITPRYLASVTSAVEGASPKQIIDRFIMDEIKIMLTFSDFTLQQIADRLHFPDSSYLGRFFRHYMGTSPSTWRKREMTL